MDRIVQRVDELPDFSGEQVLICDTETTGLFGHLGDRICGISIGPWDRDENYYIPIRHAFPATLTRSEGKLVPCHAGYMEKQNVILFDVLAWMRRLMENPARTWVFHNAKFDLGMFRRDEVECRGMILDTLLMAHGIVSNLPNYQLDTLTKLLLKDFKHPRHEELVGWFQDSMGINLNARKYTDGDEPPNFSFAPIEILGAYAIEDLQATRLVYQALRTKPGNTKIPNQGNKSDTQRDLINRENALEKVIFEMEDRGVKIDIQRCCELRDKTNDEIEQFSSKLFELSGGAFRISSWKELWKAFERAGGQVLYWTKKEADKYKQKADKFTENQAESSGRPCWNSAAIAKYLARFLKENNKAGFQFVYNYYQCDHRMRIMSNYITTILERVDHFGVLHSSIKQHGTLHGRFSSSGPNCFSEDTEVLTDQGWKFFKDLDKTEKVAQYNYETGLIDFEKPKGYIKKLEDTMLNISTDEGQIDLMITEDHNCLLKSRKGGFKFFKASEYKPDYKQFQAGQYVGGSKKLSKNQIMFICALQADGSENESGGLSFGFVKKRKIERFLTCLNNLNINYKEYAATKGRRFYISSKNIPEWVPKKRKEFGSWLLGLERESFNLFFEEVFYWDGSFTRRNNYSCNYKINTDWVQILAILNNRRAKIREYLTTAGNINYQVDISPNEYSMTTNFNSKKRRYDSYVYCVEMPLGTVIVRRNGKVAITGNCQNITKSEGNADMKKIEKILGIKDEQAVNRKLRDLFIPRPGFTWVSIDWKQIEYLVVTYFSCDEDMIRRFWENPDLDYHQITADLAGIDRDWAKTVNFGTLYGMGVGSLAAMLGITREAAQLLLDKIFGARPALKRIINQVSESVRKNGYIINPLGRKVPCAPEFAYVGLNYWVAGTVGDMMKERMLAIYEQIVANKWPVYMLLTVHDELCFEIETSRVSELAPKLGEIMCKVDYIKMPVRCDIEVGTSWGTVKPLKEWKAA